MYASVFSLGVNGTYCPNSPYLIMTMRKAFDIFRGFLLLAAGASLLAASARAADTLPPDTTSKLQAFALATNNMAANPSGTNKMILLIISDTNSCTACRSLEFGILPSKAVSDFIAESFVYWACSPEVNCNQYTDYTGNGAVALPTCFMINPFSKPKISLYSSTGADQANTYFQWLSSSLLKATAPLITGMNFNGPNTVVVSGRSFSTNVSLKTIRYKLNDGAWSSVSIPAGTFGSAFQLPQLTTVPNGQNKLYVYGMDSSGTYKSRTNIVDLVPSAPKVTPNVAVTANPGSTTTYGQPVQFTAAVTGGAGQSSGTVQFMVNNVNSGSPVALNGGSATFTAPKLAKGSTTIKAVYSGDAAYNSAEGSAVQTVNAASLNVTATGTSREYNGNNTATVTLNVSGVSAGDDVTVNYTSAAFTDKHAGTGKQIAVSGLGLAGAAASNYQLDAGTLGATANITRRPITVTAVTDSKVHDGTTASSKQPIIGGTIAPGDTAAFLQVFADAAPGTNKTINVTGMVQDGNNGQNYVVTPISVYTGIIEASTSSAISATVTPENSIVKPGGSLTLTATVQNGAGETFQWRKNGAVINGANGSTLALSNVAQTDAGSYQVVVNGSATSSPAGVWVSGDPKLYWALPVFGPGSQPLYFQSTSNLTAGGSVWQTVTNSGVTALGPQVIVSEEFSTDGASNRFYRLFIPGK